MHYQVEFRSIAEIFRNSMGLYMTLYFRFHTAHRLSNTRDLHHISYPWIWKHGWLLSHVFSPLVLNMSARQAIFKITLQHWLDAEYPTYRSLVQDLLKGHELANMAASNHFAKPYACIGFSLQIWLNSWRISIALLHLNLVRWRYSTEVAN